MRTFEEFEAEVFSAVKNKKIKIKERIRLISSLSACLCICVIITAIAIPLLQNSISTNDVSGSKENSHYNNKEEISENSKGDDTTKNEISNHATENSGVNYEQQNGDFSQNANSMVPSKHHLAYLILFGEELYKNLHHCNYSQIDSDKVCIKFFYNNRELETATVKNGIILETGKILSESELSTLSQIIGIELKKGVQE